MSLVRSRPTRREVLRAAGAATTVAGLASLGSHRALLDALAATPRRAGRLTDIEHVVILIQENRSFDNYFGTLSGVRGFGDPQVMRLHDGSGLPVFAQPGYPVAGFGGHLYPFHLDSRKGGECTNDITHEWGAQHEAWDHGAMDGFVREHLAHDGPANGPLTMGYYRREDLSFYYALADAFTICDGYHCSVLGPTDPNRLYSMTATLDPGARNGGPHLTTLVANRTSKFGTYTWTTMPEQLSARGVSWKVYSDADGNFGDNVLEYFRNYQTNPQLAAQAFAPSFPGSFQSDIASGQLPQVSWVLAPLVQTEHPPAPVELGEYATSQVLSALTSNPAVWAKTALFVSWDENGGFFDHVAPPTPPPGTAGEYLTVNPLPAAASGIAGPVGLGFRVPLLIASPFSRGGYVCSDTFDHTSLLRFLETRFGAEVPNLSAWRRSVTGDLTSAFNFVTDDSVPTFPATSATDPAITQTNCPTNAPASEINEGGPTVATYPVPPNHMPAQEAGTRRRAGARPGGGSGPGHGRGPGRHKKHHRKKHRHRAHHHRHHRRDPDHDHDRDRRGQR